MPVRSRVRRHTPAPLSESLARLGERIRQARSDAGLSQAELGRPHFTRAYVSALELGKIRPAMKSLEFLAAKLGKPPSYFLEDAEEERKRKEREVLLARATQLIAQGSCEAAVDALRSIELEGLPLRERLAIKRVLGRAYVECGDATKAVEILSGALRSYLALGDGENVARVRGLLGSALIMLLGYAEAEGHLRAALSATVEGTIRDPLFRVQVLHNLGVVLYQRADYRAALDHFERAANEGADISDHKWLASVYAAIGMSRREVGDYEGAVTYLLRSETLFGSIDNRARVAEVRFQAARTLIALGSKSRAAEMIEQALNAAEAAGNEPLAVRIAAFKGLSAAQEGDFAAALATLEPLVLRAEATGNGHARFAARFTLAGVLVEVDTGRGISLLRELEGELEGTSALADLAQVYDELGKALTRQGRTEEGVVYAQRAYATSLGSKKGGA